MKNSIFYSALFFLLFYAITTHGQTTLSLNGPANYYEIQDDIGNPSFHVAGTSGLVGIGTSAPTEQLEVFGSFINTNKYPSGAEGFLMNLNSAGPVGLEYIGAKYINLMGDQLSFCGAGDLGPSAGAIIAFEDSPNNLLNSAAALEEHVVLVYDLNGVAPKEVSVGATGVRTDGDLYPRIDDQDNLGLLNNRWKEVFAALGTINTSDRREKENIRDLNYGLTEVMQLRPVSFTWKNHEERGTKLGLIAQETHEVLDEVVKKGEKPEDRWGIYYSDIIPVLISGMQEQQQIINELKGQLNTQDERIARLEAMLSDNGGTKTIKLVNRDGKKCTSPDGA